MESMEENDAIEKSLLLQAVPDCVPYTVDGGGEFDCPPLDHNISNNYGVSVPRCVWRSDRNYMGPDGLPASPCNPPYGYPLYFKRAEKIGIPEAGVAKIAAAKTSVITNLAHLRSRDGKDQFEHWINSTWKNRMDKEGLLTDIQLGWIEHIKKTHMKNKKNYWYIWFFFVKCFYEVKGIFKKKWHY